MELDSTHLFISMAFGSIGFGYFVYGKKQGKPIALISGILLMACPYFLPSILSMVIGCCVFMVFPFLAHRYWDL